MAMLMISLVPTLTIAFPMHEDHGFIQQVCTTQGNKLVIVSTTQGKQLSMLISYKPSEKPISLSHHLNHCPFCHIAMDKVVIPSHSPAFVLYQQAQIRISLSDYKSPVISNFKPTAHTSRAPPQAPLQS
ncbi:DUF2946 family protein [Methylophilus sp. 14]|uniref:DUF2946 family protein n=1 Tax=Methylophilus sp. 14 TaxID=2781019 RepID=UPI0021049E08|nr:DUF2946 family protein [Methylophilus sp. 14]